MVSSRRGTSNQARSVASIVNVPGNPAVRATRLSWKLNTARCHRSLDFKECTPPNIASKVVLFPFAGIAITGKVSVGLTCPPAVPQGGPFCAIFRTIPQLGSGPPVDHRGSCLCHPKSDFRYETAPNDSIAKNSLICEGRQEGAKSHSRVVPTNRHTGFSRCPEAQQSPDYVHPGRQRGGFGWQQE